MTRVSVIGDALVLAATSEPGTLRDLAERAQVGDDAVPYSIVDLHMMILGWPAT